MDKIYSKDPLPIIPISISVEEELAYMKDRKDGKIRSLKTPWKKYNHVAMGGIEWHTMHTIAGMSGSGKTAILNQLETEVLTLNPWEEFDVLSFNFEMLARNLVGRKLSNKLNKTVQYLHSGEYGVKLSDTDYNRAVIASESIKDLPIHYVESSGTVNQIMDTVFEFSNTQGYKTDSRSQYKRGLLVLLDHTILVQGKTNEMERLTLFDLTARAKKALKWFYANNRQVSFVFLSQMNRDIEKPERTMDASLHFPKKSDIFGGDSCYQFSDIVMVSMNPFQNNLTTYGPSGWSTENALFWHFLKVREGAPLIAKMENKLAYNKVLDWEYKPDLALDSAG